jgi:signal transduction histidine kinase
MGDEREPSAVEARLHTARTAARTQSERTLALVLDRLLVDSGAALGRLIGYDAVGHEAALVERGPLDETRVHAALLDAAQLEAPRRDDGTLVLPLRLADRTVGVAVLDAVPALDASVVSEASVRAAIGVGNALVLGSAQARTFLVAELAHEIRNPLAGILAFSDLLPEEASELPPKFIHLMTHIQGDAQRLKRLIEGVLSMVGANSGADRLACIAVDVRPLLESLLARFAPWAERRGVALNLAADGIVLGDREAIALVVANLVANAMTATPTGGSVTVRARPGPDREPRWGAPGRAVWLEVVDTGPGLNAATVESARGGGLHIARDLVTSLGGSLWAEDVQNGARLVLRLPASPA